MARSLRDFRKRLLIATLVLATACSLVGCASSEAPSTQEPSAESTAAEGPTEAPVESAQETPEPTTPPEPTAAQPPPPPEETLAIYNGMVITATGEDPIADGVVVVERGVITAVGSADEVTIPDDAIMIDAGGGTIMPGIINARTSLLLNELPIKDGVIDPVGLEVFLVRALKAGVTTVRDGGGLDRQIHPDLTVLRNALIAQGNHVPTFVMVGPLLAHAESNVYEIYAENDIGVVTLDEARQGAEELVAFGVDQLGFLQAIPPDTRAANTYDSRTGLDFEQQQAIVTIAHEHGLQVLAQAAFPEDAAAALAAGVDQLAIWPTDVTDEPLSVELIEAIVDNAVPVVTGFSVGPVRPHEGDVRRFIDAGGTVVFGTLSPNSGPLTAYYKEMELMQRFQMTPMEIIIAATANAAKAVGLGDEVGTLEVGKTADIIVVNGNPLEDLRAFDGGVTVVIKGGEVVGDDS